ncbi:major facilitator superfamily domain-containing protein [Globomyces pollinis-pini]|nr:major facilitator superfamily domain-containing protein [Globomyces pollinis-pini]
MSVEKKETDVPQEVKTSNKFDVLAPFRYFSKSEQKNLTFYIIGIMLYKFGYESINASMNGIIINRLYMYPKGLSKDDKSGIEVNATAVGLNYFCQVIGSLSIGPLFKRFHAKTVLCCAILCYATVIAIVPFMEVISGGKIPGSAGSKASEYWGSFSAFNILPIFAVCGIFHGMVELMRRVIPADIVGGDSDKLKRMDSMVHIFYETTGTVGATFAFVWIGYFGWGYVLLLPPICFMLSALSWSFIIPRPEEAKAIEQFREEHKDQSILAALGEVFYAFFHSVYFGAKLVLTQRALVWLIPAYTLPLVLHRYLENTLFPNYLKVTFDSTDAQTILVGGSNFGELLGALTIMVVAKHVYTPIPWLRLDVIMMSFVWILPFMYAPTNLDAKGFAPIEDIYTVCWQLAPFMSLISFGWAAGDISLAAYVQSRLEDYKQIDKFTTPLGAVMSFLYVVYLVVFYCLNTLMSSIARNWGKDNRQTLWIIAGGGFMSICGVIVMVSTFIPRGAFAWNPNPDVVVFDGGITLGGVELQKRTEDEKGEENLAELAVA